MEHDIEGHQITDSNNLLMGFRLEEATIGHMMLLLSKGGSLMRGEVGLVEQCMETGGVGPDVIPEIYFNWNG